MSRSHDEIAEEICDNLRPLKRRVGDVHSAVIQRIDLINEVYPKLQPVSRVRLIKLKATKADNAAAALQAAILELQKLFESAALPSVQTLRALRRLSLPRRTPKHRQVRAGNASKNGAHNIADLK